LQEFQKKKPVARILLLELLELLELLGDTVN
jgi:hypothetical protein